MGLAMLTGHWLLTQCHCPTSHCRTAEVGWLAIWPRRGKFPREGGAVATGAANAEALLDRCKGLEHIRRPVETNSAHHQTNDFLCSLS